MQSQFIDCCNDQNINGEHVKHLKMKCSDIFRFNSSRSAVTYLTFTNSTFSFDTITVLDTLDFLPRRAALLYRVLERRLIRFPSIYLQRWDNDN